MTLSVLTRVCALVIALSYNAYYLTADRAFDRRFLQLRCPVARAPCCPRRYKLVSLGGGRGHPGALPRRRRPARDVALAGVAASLGRLVVHGVRREPCRRPSASSSTAALPHRSPQSVWASLRRPGKIFEVGRDEADAQLLAGAWRYLVYRDAPANLLRKAHSSLGDPPAGRGASRATNKATIVTR